MKKDKIIKVREKSLEDLYREIVQRARAGSVRDEIEESLEQPHVCKFVDSITTYGAYQKPI